MTKETFNLIAEAIDKEGCLYDAISNNTWRLEKEDLKNFVSELIWVATRRLDEEDAKAFEEEVMQSILENCVDED